jgi:hypothetical protein
VIPKNKDQEAGQLQLPMYAGTLKLLISAGYRHFSGIKDLKMNNPFIK